jgi:hypothetical protein
LKRETVLIDTWTVMGITGKTKELQTVEMNFLRSVALRLKPSWEPSDKRELKIIRSKK